jgi:hypothetical protein
VTVGKNGVSRRGEPKLCFSCGSPDHILPCPLHSDLQYSAIQKLRENPSHPRRVFKEFVVQIEESLAVDLTQDGSDWDDKEPGEEGEAVDENEDHQETDINS